MNDHIEQYFALVQPFLEPLNLLILQVYVLVHPENAPLHELSFFEELVQVELDLVVHTLIASWAAALVYNAFRLIFSTLLEDLKLQAARLRLFETHKTAIGDFAFSLIFVGCTKFLR